MTLPKAPPARQGVPPVPDTAKKAKKAHTAATIAERVHTVATLPLVLFTLLFVLGPLVYMVVLSFLTRAETWGVVGQFTLKNYADILEPVYLGTFVQSLRLALTTTVLVSVLGYAFGYYMARLEPGRRRLVMMLVMVPFWTSSLLRLYGWLTVFRANGILDKLLMALGIIDRPLKLLYTYPAVVVGMVYALLPFMILSVYSSVEKMDWSLVEAARDMGASRARAFLTITLPMTASGLLSGCVLVFVPAIGLFFMSDLLGGSMELYVGNLVRDQLLKARDWPFAAAISVVLLVLVSAILYAYRRAGGKSSDMTLF